MYLKRHISIPIDSLATGMSKNTSQDGNNSPQATGSGAVEVEKLYVLGIPLHKTSKSFQFLVAVVGIMMFYLVYGYIQVIDLFVSV